MGGSCPYPKLLQPRDWDGLSLPPTAFPFIISAILATSSFRPLWPLGLLTSWLPLSSHDPAWSYWLCPLWIDLFSLIVTVNFLPRHT